MFAIPRKGGLMMCGMIALLLAYAKWNGMAYLSLEQPRRNYHALSSENGL